jgi:hypothetical protein
MKSSKLQRIHSSSLHCNSLESSISFSHDYKMKYPGKEAYHFPVGPSHLSPCMDSFWRIG